MSGKIRFVSKDGKQDHQTRSSLLVKADFYQKNVQGGNSSPLGSL
jgi:hypothetical protein